MARSLSEIRLSALDLATIVEGDSSAGDAFKRSLTFAQHAERLGYTRYWFAEHHNMESVASAATAVLIGYVAGGTSTLRIGSGGVMLPNHAPLVIAEQFGTLAELYPGRIDLGLGRAPGTDQPTMYALRRNLKGDITEFPNDVAELLRYLGPKVPGSKVNAIPGQGTGVPVWLLGSSTYSAQLAAEMGLPFAFASHFAPTYLHEALEIYRSNFKPSAFLHKPYAMACVNVIVADTDEDARFMATSFYQLALGIFRKDRHPLPKPVESMEGIWSDWEEQGVLQMMHYSFIGSPATVRASLQKFVDNTSVDELMVSSHLYDPAAKIRSLEHIASMFGTLASSRLGVANAEIR
jgi:luciferase family oxidoreductase group 1